MTPVYSIANTDQCHSMKAENSTSGSQETVSLKYQHFQQKIICKI